MDFPILQWADLDHGSRRRRCRSPPKSAQPRWKLALAGTWRLFEIQLSDCLHVTCQRPWKQKKTFLNLDSDDQRKEPLDWQLHAGWQFPGGTLHQLPVAAKNREFWMADVAGRHQYLPSNPFPGKGRLVPICHCLSSCIVLGSLRLSWISSEMVRSLSAMF